MQTMLLILLAALLGGIWLRNRFASFGAQRPADYADLGPIADIRTEMDGKILCEGVIYGPLGRVSSRFVAEMNGSWEGNVGTMTEHFRYDNGNTQDRIWTLTLHEDGQITATAPDLVGAGHGMQAGPAVHLKYRITLPQSAGGHTLSVTDWMYLCDNGTLINRSQFRKFGIKVAELVATMRKV